MHLNKYFFCGWIRPQPQDNWPHAFLSEMLKPIPSENLELETQASFSVASVKNTQHFLDNKFFVLATGNYYFDDSKDALKLHSPKDIAVRYAKEGIKFLDKLKGRFSLFIVDLESNSSYLILDRIGQSQLFYSFDKNSLIFSSNAKSLAFHPEVNSELSSQAIFDYMYFHSVPSPSSIFKGQNKLVNGHYLKFCNGQVETINYWQPNFIEDSSLSIEEHSEEMLSIIKHSVQRHADTDNIGAFLSGGLDSSTVSGMLSLVKPKASTFSIGFPVEGYDETEYARIASKHFNTDQHEYFLQPDDVVDALPLIAASFDEPFGNSSALPTFFCAKFAKSHGIDCLLAGDGGDEIFAGNERYAKQEVFQLYSHLPSPIRALLESPLLHNNMFRAIPGLKKAVSYVDQAKIPLPDRMETYNFLHQFNIADIFDADFLSQVNPSNPLDILRKQYAAPENASELNRMMYLDWKRTLHDNDLVKVNQMSGLAGVDSRYPLLDDALIEFSCRVPSNIKLKDRKLRWFYKQAISKFLPNEIINKKKHGFGLPFGIWTREHAKLRDLAYENVSNLKKRHLFSTQFLDQAVDMHRSGHASYFGELIWVLMMLELWLSSSEL